MRSQEGIKGRFKCLLQKIGKEEKLKKCSRKSLNRTKDMALFIGVIYVTGGRFDGMGPLACLSPVLVPWIGSDKCSHLRLLTRMFLFIMFPIKVFHKIYALRLVT